MSENKQKRNFPTLALLRAFYEVARARSFKQAAEYLNVSQPTIVKQISDLERMYKGKLFIRSRSNNRLTDLGLQLMPLCRSVIMGVEEIDELMRSHGRLEQGSLAIAAVSPHHVTQALKRFTAKHPNIKIKVIYGATKKAKSLLLAGEVDIALFVNNEAVPGFHGFLCVQDKLIAIIPSCIASSKKDNISLHEFSQHIFISREKGSVTRSLIETAMQEKNIIPKSILEIGSREAVREAVIQGIGLSVVTEHEHITHPGIVAKSFSDINLGMKYSYMVANKRLNSHLIRAFLKCAEPELQEPLFFTSG